MCQVVYVDHPKLTGCKCTHLLDVKQASRDIRRGVRLLRILATERQI